MKSDYNFIPKIIRNTIFNSKSGSIKVLLAFVIVLAIVALIHGSIKEDIVNSTSILIIVITAFSIYIVVKKQYNKKLMKLEKQLKIYKEPTVLDALCENDDWNTACPMYNRAKKNFYKISNLLIQKYKFNKKFD